MTHGAVPDGAVPERDDVNGLPPRRMSPAVAAPRLSRVIAVADLSAVARSAKADVAQLAERVLGKDEVTSSILVIGSILRSRMQAKDALHSSPEMFASDGAPVVRGRELRMASHRGTPAGMGWLRKIRSLSESAVEEFDERGTLGL